MFIKSVRNNIVGLNIKRIRQTGTKSVTQEQLATEMQILGWSITRYGISKIEKRRKKSHRY